MAQVYVNDEVKKKLDKLAAEQHRDLGDEIDYLTEKELKSIKDEAQNKN